MTASVLTVSIGTRNLDTPQTAVSAVTWIDVTEAVELQDQVSIQWGRQDGISQADPNSCTLTFEGSKFRRASNGLIISEIFLAGATDPDLVIGLPLRVQATPPGNAIRDRFVGYVSSITPLWPSGDTEHLRLVVRAESRLAWLARARSLQDPTSSAMLAAGATSYWPMTEKVPNFNNLSDPSPPWFEYDEQPYVFAVGKNPKGLTGGFGVVPIETLGPSPDGLGVANISIGPTPLDPTVGDKFEPRQGAASVAPIPVIGATQAFTVAMIGRSGRGPLTDKRTFEIFTLTGRDDVGLHNAFASEGALRFVWDTSTLGSGLWTLSVIDGSTLVNTGFGTDDLGDNSPMNKAWHLYTMTSSGGSTPTIKGYRDDELVVTMGPLAAGDMSAFNGLIVGNMTYLPDGTDTNADGFADSNFVLADDPRHEFGRLAIFAGTALTLGQVGDLSDAVLDTLGEDDTVTERLQRWFTYAGFLSTQLTITDPGSTPLTPQEVSGSSPMSLLHDVAATDGGVIFDRREGRTRYLGRSVRTSATTPSVTLDAAAQEIVADLSLPVDVSEVVNSVSYRAADDSASVTRTDGASVDLYGYSGEEVTLHTNSQAILLGRADWRLYVAAQPRPRAPSLTVELSSLSNLNQALLTSSSFEIGSLIEVTNMPADLNGVPSYFFLEGTTETWGVASCVLSMVVSDATPELSTFLLDDTTRGDLDSIYVLG